MQPAGGGAALEPNPEVQRPTLPLSTPPPKADGGVAATPDRALLTPGSVVEQYEIVRELGRGGMSRVFLARDVRLARPCAIKLLLEHTGAGAGRFLAEARATALCRHENIVTIYEVDEFHGCPYMVLEYLEGQTLRAWMLERASHEPVRPSLAIELVVPVVRALACAHAMGIVHQDLKPENIFLTEAGPIKVLDFGIAKRIGIADSGSIRLGSLVGTLQYMSPEQWLGLEIDPRADLWALGIILHELVTGTHPLEPAAMPQLLEVQDLAIPMPSVFERRSDVGPLGAVIDRCLKKQAAERIGSAAELLAELEAIAAGREEAGPTLSPAPTLTPAPVAASSPAPAPSPAPVSSPPRRHRRTVALAAVGVGAAAVLAVVAGRAFDRGAIRGVRSAGIAITGVPLPASRYPEAIAAYAAALHDLRDSNAAIAEDQLRRAISLDPMLAAAHLRLAILLAYTAGWTPEARKSYALAVQWRAALSPRDLEILTAFEPLLNRDPSELPRFNAQLTELARRRSDDAEILALLAYFGIEGPEVQLRAARRAVEIDPGYADAWQAIGKHLFTLRRSDEALSAFDACLAASPAAVDCLGERARVYAAQGRCDAVEADLRNAFASNPQSRFWRDLRASSLMALGKPVEAAIEVLTWKWAGQPESLRELVELDDRARLDLLRGHFEAARASAAALQARARHHADADQHARYAGLLIDLAVEADRLDDAARVADDYLRLRDARIGSGSIVDDLAMFTTLRDAGRLSAADFEARRAEWLIRHRDLAGSLRNEIWLAAWARPATTPEAAAAALAAAPAADLPSLVQGVADHAVLGTLLLRAGRAAEAVRFLERAALGCDGFLAPTAHVRAAVRLGQARELTGDRAGACAAYQGVLDRWGAGASPSATARDARLRATALGCAPAARGERRPDRH